MKIIISEEMMDYIQFLNFEYMGLQNIVKNMIVKDKKSNKYDYDKELLNYYMERVKEQSVKLNLAKLEIIKEYKHEWSDKEVIFNFIDCSISVSSKECSCCGSK